MESLNIDRLARREFMVTRRTSYFPVLILIMAQLSPSMVSPRLGRLSCPRIAGDKRPALLFVDGSPDESRLWVAYANSGELRREFVLSARYLEVTQLDNSVFLVSAPGSPQRTETYAMDLESGTARLIGQGPNLRCLRAEPARKTAMLIESDRSASEDRLIELGLVSLTTAERIRLPRTMLVDERTGIITPYKISPDFARIAFVTYEGGRGVERESEFELKSLDLRTLKVQVLDSDVRVRIPGISSFSHGIPPFEWISDSQILYQHMIGQERTDGGFGSNEGAPRLTTDALCVFKIVDIRTGEITERFRQQLRMELNGGSLGTDPLTGRLAFNRNYVLDPVQNRLIDRILPYSISSDPAQRRTEIRSAADVLYSGDAMSLETCLSASGKYFAYALRPAGTGLAAEVYAVFNADRKPLSVAAGTFSPTRAIGWIE